MIVSGTRCVPQSDDGTRRVPDTLWVKPQKLPRSTCCRCWPRRCKSFAAKARAPWTTWRSSFVGARLDPPRPQGVLGAGITPRGRGPDPGPVETSAGRGHAPRGRPRAVLHRREAGRRAGPSPGCHGGTEDRGRPPLGGHDRPRGRRFPPRPHPIRHLVGRQRLAGGCRPGPDERVACDLYFPGGAERAVAARALPEKAEKKDLEP